MIALRRLTPVLCLAALLAVSGTPPLSGAPSAEEVERFPGPVTGETYTVYRDATSGSKWIAGPHGRRFENLAAVRYAEYSSLGDTMSRLDRGLRERLADPERADEPLAVALVLREQPMRAVAARLKAELRRELEDLSGPAARDRIHQFRREVLGESAPRCETARAPVIARLGAVEVLGTNDILNAIFVEVAPSDLPDLLRRNPEVWTAAVLPTVEVELTNSVPATGVSSWWTGGYTGSGVTVGIIDSGFDNQHPYFKNSITHEAVYLTYGKSESNFNDDSTKTDDFHGHGTHVGSTVGGYDSTYTGVAKAANLVNGKCFYLTTTGTSSGNGADIFYCTKWALQYCDVLNLSWGGSGGAGDSVFALYYDAITHDLGVAVAAAAGNSGSSSGTVLTPGDAFNVVTVGAYDDKNNTSTSDDALASFSSRGPTSDGRRKPDLVAPGVSIVAANNNWEGSANDYRSMSGTSMATPHVAGALAVLLDYDSTFTPQAMKALLVNTVRNSSPYPTSPDNNWGYGGMDLSTAYTDRANVLEDSITSDGDTSIYFTRSSALSSGDRSTLVWFEHVTYSSSNWPGTPPALTDLDLLLYDGSTGSVDVTSTSSVNSVEQVRASSSVSSPVIRVELADDLPTGISTQDFALAAPSGFSKADPPALTCTFGSIDDPLGPSESFSVEITVTNDGDLTAFDPDVTLTVPSGFSISGDSTQTVDDLGPGDSDTATFSVTSSSSSVTADLKAQAETLSFGETFTGEEETKSITVDADAPTGSVSIEGGDDYAGGSSVTLTLSATDSGGSVQKMRFSNDDSSWSTWESYSTSKSWTLASGEGTRTVYVQYQDNEGNNSSSYSDSIVVDTTAPSGSVSIDSGASYAAGASVTLTLAASDSSSGLAEMRLRNSGESWGSWETFSTSKGFALASGEGTRTVEAQFRDTVGNESTTASDSIVVDTTAPVGYVAIDLGADYTTDTGVGLSLTATDGSSGVTEMRFSNDNSSWTGWLTYATSASWTLTTGDGTKTVYVGYRDAAGNVSSTTTDTIVLDTVAPTCSVTIAGGASHVAGSSVSVALSGTDGGSGISKMRFSNNGTSWSSWESVSLPKSWTLASGEGTRTVYAQLMDKAGNVSTKGSDTVVVDATAPTGSVSINDGDGYVGGASVTLTLLASDGSSGVDEMRLRSFGESWGAWESYATTKSWTLVTGEGSRTVEVQFRDAVGNESTTVTDSIVVDTTAPTGAVSIDGGAEYTDDTTVTLALSATDGASGVASMRFSTDGSTWSSWESYAATKAYSLPTGDGTKTVYAQFRDTAGNVSSSTSASISLDTTAPGGTVSVDGGDAWTTSRPVTLSLAATDGGSGVAEMSFSDGGVNWSAWETFAGTKAWTLPAGDGSKTVHVRYRDAAGNVSDPAEDSIGLDTVAPTGSILVAAGAAWTSNGAVSLTLSASDATSGVDDVSFSDDGSTWTSWEGYAASKDWTLPDGDGAKSVYARFRDAAGNVSGAVLDGIVLDTTAPTGSVAIDGGAAWSTGTSVTLSLTRDADASGVTSMRFSHDGVVWTSWEAWDDTRLWTLEGADGEKTVFVRFRDAAGNVSLATTDKIGLDRAAPTGTVEIEGGAEFTNEGAVSLGLAASDATSGVAEMQFSSDGTSWTGWEPFSTVKARALSSGDGAKTAYARFRDAAGNVSPSATDGIVLDTTAPTGSVLIDDDWPATNMVDVGLAIGGADALSGVDVARCSDDGETWTEWAPLGETHAWTLPDGEGAKTVYVQVRDRAGNESAPFTDGILLDMTSPIGSFTVNDDALYVLPAEDLELDVDATDEEGGSGVRDFRTSFDGGTTWSDWYALGGGSPVVVDRSGNEGGVDAQVVVRDVAGNESAASVVHLHLVPGSPRAPGLGAKYAGTLGSETEIDTIAVDLVEGDLLTVKIKGKGAEKKTKLDLAVDLALLSGGRLVTDRWPAGTKKAGIRKYAAPATGTYLLTLRRAATSTASTGTYKLSVKAKQAAGNKKRKGSAPAGAITFDAVAGSTLSATLQAEGLTADAVSLVGPDGPVAFTASEKRGKVTPKGTVLGAGTGTYELTVDGAKPFAFKLKIKLPKKPKGLVTE